MDVSMELMTTMMMQADNRLHHNPGFSRIAPGEAPPHLQNQSTKWYAELEKQRSIAAMREMMFRIAAMQPVQIDPEAIKPPKRKNVKISTDPQSVAARRRRERISEKIRMLQRMVPGGTKMDTASMLDEAIHYVKFLKKQVVRLESVALGFEEFPLKMLENEMMMGLGGSMQQMMC